jgi:DNA repair exonuclease SbcCD nuclease subunit
MTHFRFLHAADIHLDSPLRGLASYPDAPIEQIRSASRRALDNLIDLAIDQNVAFVLLAGDISDGDWKDYNTSLFFVQRMGRLREAGIRVFMVYGNHDAASVITKALRPPDNVHIFSVNQPESVPLQYLPVVIHGQGYKNRDIREDLAAGYPQAVQGVINIGLLHTSLTGRSAHEPYAPTRLDVLFSKGYDYWALGHIHQREIVSQDPWIVFSGNIQGRHIKETGAKGCSLVQVDEGRITEVDHMDLDVLRWQDLTVDLSDSLSQEDLWDLLRTTFESALDQSEGRTLALRLHLQGQSALHTWLHLHWPYVVQECSALAIGLGEIWLEKVLIETRAQNDPEESFDVHSSMASLVRSLKGISLTEDFRQQIPELDDLQKKLPPELTTKEERFDFNDPEYLYKIQNEVRELLLGRLLRQ